MLAFGEAQEPLEAGSASSFLQPCSEEPCAPPRAKDKVWGKKGQVAMNYLSIFPSLSDQELCWGVT